MESRTYRTRRPPFLGALLSFLVLAIALLTPATSARAEERLALIIGNSNYAAVSHLDNPVRDARLIATTLESLGFEVTLAENTTQIAMKRSIAQFGRRLRQAGEDATGLFYYAGHGVQSFGSNYLLPVDVALADAADLDLLAIEAQSVLRQMASARNRTNIVILDACRNNPFETVPDLDESGLAEMKAPTGTFLAYATAPGDVALDGEGQNSPFTQALAREITVPGQPVEQAFKQVRRAVLEQSRGKQTPWDTSSLVSDFVFAPAEAHAPSVALGSAESEEAQVWQSVRSSRDAMQIMLFLRGYGQGRFADEARTLLADLMAEELNEGSPKEETPAPSEAETVARVARETPEPAAQVTFTSPLVGEIASISGLTLAEAVTRAPVFPPIEGLPENLWKEQSCSNCHQWTRERLCTQGNTYLSLNMQRSLGKQHPFGGAFKRALKNWAAGGCK